MSEGGEGCKNRIEIQFNRYDQYVDVVSCWQEFFESFYSEEEDIAKFERYPSVPNPDPDSDQSLKPDFTAVFSKEYGMIFELKRTLPDDKEEFISAISQLEKYDQDLKLKGDGERVLPDTTDIVLLVGSSDFHDIEARIKKVISEGELELDSNLILMQYNYVSEDSNPCYKFIRSKELDNFRDSSLPEDKQMSDFLTHDEDQPFKSTFRPIKVPVENFVEYKAREELMNDSPPPIYLACFLWHHVFYEYLTGEQEMQWRRGNPNKILRFKISVSDLKENLNEVYLPNYNFGSKEIKRTLDFMADANLARHESGKKYVIRFRNLRSIRNEGKKTEFQDLARMIAIHYCKHAEEHDMKSDGETTIPDGSDSSEEEQASLEDMT